MFCFNCVIYLNAVALYNLRSQCTTEDGRPSCGFTLTLLEPPQQANDSVQVNIASTRYTLHTRAATDVSFKARSLILLQTFKNGQMR
jgi:hypothetical protein